MIDPLQGEIDEQVERLGFEVVDLERAGSRARPILRLRIDRLDAGSDEGVTLEDCTRVSRALEATLDERSDLPPRYVLEVSSPGVERPLVRTRDFQRFVGREIAVHSRKEILPGAKRVEGELLGLEEGEEGERILLRSTRGDEVAIPRADTTKVHLVYRWGGGGCST
ncbi:MAG: ribosome maturation factor RimP [Gemmatimonadota bacterium]